MLESLSDMLKQMPMSKRMEQAEQAVGQLMAEPLVREFRLKHPELDDLTVKIHLNRLYQYVKEYKTCSRCPGLDRCPNDLTGHYTLLQVQTIREQHYIIDQKVPCRKQLSRQSKDAVRSRIRSFYVDESALEQGYSLEEILSRDRDRVGAVERVIAYIERTVEEGLQKRGLYLAGNFGTGKTFLLCYMLHELAKAGLSGVIVYMPDFMEDLKSMFGEPQRLKETIELLKNTDLLVFDDIGAENLNPWARDHVLGTILNYRMNRKPTFFTSNYELNDLEKHFSFTSKDGDEAHKGIRLMDRIRPFVDVVLVAGANKRGG